MLLDQEIHERGGCIKKTVRMITEQPCSPFEAKMAGGGAHWRCTSEMHAVPNARGAAGGRTHVKNVTRRQDACQE